MKNKRFILKIITFLGILLAIYVANALNNFLTGKTDPEIQENLTDYGFDTTDRY